MTLSFIKNLNWRLNFAFLFLTSLGLLSLFSTSPNFFWRQLTWLGIGTVLLLGVAAFDWRPFLNYRIIIFSLYFLVILLLVAVYLFAPSVRGAKSWLFLGDFQFQPSEFMKIGLILIYSLFFSRRHAAIAKVSNLVISFIYFLIPGFLIAIQPDFGTVLVLFSIWLGFLLVSGIRWRHLLILIILMALVGSIMWQVVLKDYQKQRIMGFLFPGRDPLGINYCVIQAKIAIGSAGFLGKGFNQGTQAQLGFLPEKQTDFIFAAVIEEFGLIAGFLIITAFIFLIFEIIKVGLLAENNFGRFVCLGAVILYLTQFILNVGSNLGLTPVIGVTFPFLSYGGSSLLTNLLLIGVIQSIFIRRSL